jgi:aspartyl protease family protein
MIRGLAILFMLGASVYAVLHIEKLVDDPAVQEDFRASVSDDDRQPTGSRTVRLRADRLGHFIVDARVNGRPIEMLADTGASAVVLTQEDARRAGIDLRSLTYDIPVSTANGQAMVARVMLDRLEVRGIAVPRVRAVVAEKDVLESSLLGMTFLNRLASVKMSGDTLELVE